jgi:hypothetical protein
MTTREALLQLLTERPGELVTYRDVCARLGHDVSRSAVSKAAGRLGRKQCVGKCGARGGYLYRLPKEESHA